MALISLAGVHSVLHAQIAPQATPHETTKNDNLRIVIIEGDQFTNNIKKRTTREPIVEVRDKDGKRVPGAAVVFLLPQDGAGGTFANGSKVLNVITDQNGRAVARTLRPNNVAGSFKISVTASLNGQIATAVITQTNALIGAGAAGVAGAGAGAAGGGALGATTIAVLAGGVATAAIVTAKLLTNGNAKKARITIGQPTLP
ncbi:MAG: hypothetical protein M3Z23_07180 [Acidobacteriota bacterium]|nr:hypothetical protein [Acidobacteriota bacterium]